MSKDFNACELVSHSISNALKLSMSLLLFFLTLHCVDMAMNRLDGKVAVITGGARGLGKAVALALVDRGAKVMIGDLLDEQGAQAVDELNARYDQLA